MEGVQMLGIVDIGRDKSEISLRPCRHCFSRSTFNPDHAGV